MFANATPFAALTAPFHDERGIDAVVVLAKATFVLRSSRLALADEQVPVRLRDAPTDPAAVEAGRESSVRYPSDLGGTKPGADIVVVGCAVAPRPVSSVDVAVRAPGRTVALRVHGERVFYKGALGLSISPGAPFERAAVTYERAYGGASLDGAIIDWRNPVGRGVHRAASDLDGAPAPCVEDPAHPIDGARRAIPAGFGAIPTWWLPRRDLMGTADAAWQAERMPVPPLDFDPRFYQVAHPSLQMERPLQAGDTLTTHGLCREGLFHVTVPVLALVAHLRRTDAPPAVLSRPVVVTPPVIIAPPVVVAPKVIVRLREDLSATRADPGPSPASPAPFGQVGGARAVLPFQDRGSVAPTPISPLVPPAPARPSRPPVDLGSTVAATSAVSSPVLPFNAPPAPPQGASLPSVWDQPQAARASSYPPSPLPQLTIDQYAWIVAKLRQAAPADLPQTLATLRLTPSTREQLEAHWRARMAVDPALRQAFIAALSGFLNRP